MNRSISIVLFALLAGCAGDPDLRAAPAQARPIEPLDRNRWASAEPGCEGVALDDVTLYSCEGEPLLGALVAERDLVVCVDAMSVLVEELRRDTAPLGDDPSPQPSHPGPDGAVPEDGDAHAVPLSTATTARDDPTPTPVVYADPTPTPVSQPVLRDPTPTPTVEPEDEGDPTPAPAMTR